MDRHNIVLRIMAESFNLSLDSFISLQKELGNLDDNNRPTALGISHGLVLDHTEPQQINNFNSEYQSYVYFHNDIPAIGHFKVNGRINFVDAESFAVLTNYKNANELMTDNDFMLDVISMVKNDTGQSLIERINIDGTEKQYFKIDLYLDWAKNYFNK